MAQDIWEQLEGGSDDEFSDLKRQVDLVAAGLELGIDFEQHGSRWKAECPWHEDTNPSLDVYTSRDGTQRFNCAPCGIDGDIFDLVLRVPGSPADTAGDALKWVRERKGDLPEPPEAKPREPVDLREDLDNHTGNARLAMELFYAERDEAQHIDIDWIIEEFSIRATVTHTGLSIPHLPPGGWDDEVHAARLRYEDRDWKPQAITGSTHTHLYGVHRLTGDETKVLLVEGESDTWAAAYWLRDHEDWAVVGLPNGAGQPPREQWIEMLTNARVEVTVMFDGDDAGRRAAERWVSRLHTAGVATRVAPVPEESDVCTVGADHVLDAASGLSTDMFNYGQTPIQDFGTHYAVRMKDDEPPVPITDFTLSVEESFITDEGPMLRVSVSKTGKTHLIKSSDWASLNSLRAWAAKVGGEFSGSAVVGIKLGSYLMQQAAFAPTYHGVTTVGLHDRSFVLGQRVIGEQSVRWVPPYNKVPLVVAVGGDRPRSTAFDPEALVALLNVQTLPVSTVVIGWFAAAFARSEFREFPILNIHGTKGSGKTTFMQLVAKTFDFHVWASLSGGLTPYSLTSLGSCSCGVPVVMDEFRSSRLKNQTRDRLDDIWRNAWNGQTTLSGGGDNPMVVNDAKITSPLVVIGEDAADDPAMQERAVPLTISRETRGTVHPLDVEEMHLSGFGEWWANRIVEQASGDSVHFGPIPRSTGERVEHGRAVARWGYEGLAKVLRHRTGTILPDFDTGMTERMAEAASNVRPVIDAIRYLLDAEDDNRQPIAFTLPESRADEHVYVRSHALLKWGAVNRKGWPISTEQGLIPMLNAEYPTEKVRLHGRGEVLRLEGAKADMMGGVADNG